MASGGAPVTVNLTGRRTRVPLRRKQHDLAGCPKRWSPTQGFIEALMMSVLSQTG